MWHDTKLQNLKAGRESEEEDDEDPDDDEEDLDEEEWLERAIAKGGRTGQCM
jgi:hypothetical protein